MSFIPPILRFLNFAQPSDENAQRSPNTILSIVLPILQYLRLTPSPQKTLQDTRPNTPESDSAKKVTFSNSVKVTLIATREEYYAAREKDEDSDQSVASLMWYTKEEQTSFKADSLAELNACAKENGVTFKEAKNALYQPESTSRERTE